MVLFYIAIYFAHDLPDFSLFCFSLFLFFFVYIEIRIFLSVL